MPTPVTTLDPNMRLQKKSFRPVKWRSADKTPFFLAGFPWFHQDKIYRRLPLAGAKAIPPAVNKLADCTAGGQIRFQSDTRRISMRVTLSAPADMYHMAATGQCGFDLYVGSGDSVRFCGVAKFDHRQTSYEAVLFEHSRRAMRHFTLNFPLYQGVKEVQIGVDPSAAVKPPLPYDSPGRIVIYGTSITQGGCASRPGMAYPNILSRLLNREVVNLGFSGNGKGEPEVARQVAQVPRPEMFVLDYEANCGTNENLQRTLPAFVKILRKTHQTIPIIIISRIRFASDLLLRKKEKQREACRTIQAGLVKALREKGDAYIYFFDGSTLLGDDYDECTVDGVHPTDLGFMRMATGLEPLFRGILMENKKSPRREIL